MTAAPPALELASVGKRYWQLEEQAMLLKSLLPFARPKRKEIWAVRNVDLRVEPGETVGILGRNGAGKTTLLRLMAGVTAPSEGAVRIAGRVAPLISVGVGFHQEMSGRENVYVNGMLLGLTASEIEDRFDAIVAFAELADFIDTPVKFYSSGMFMRLGFAVAVHVEPDILLVDEVLAVGDIAFQFKCYERMRQLQARGTSIVIVSHAMHAIRLLCPRAVLFRNGTVEFDGPAEGAIARHYALLSVQEDGGGGEDVSLIGQELRGADGVDHHADYDQPVELRVRLRFNRAVDNPAFMFQVLSDAGLLISTTQTVVGKPWRSFAADEEAALTVRFRARFGGGSYRLALVVTEENGVTPIFRGEGLVLYVAPRVGSGGFVDPVASIDVDGNNRTSHESMSLGGPPSAPPA